MTTVHAASPKGPAKTATAQYVVARLGAQSFGIPVEQVRDVFVPERIAGVPRAHPAVAGVLNLRGHVVTAIDLAVVLGTASAASDARRKGVVMERGGALYSLMVDEVEEVSDLDETRIEPNPSTLDASWRDLSRGIWRGGAHGRPRRRAPLRPHQGRLSVPPAAPSA